MFHEYEINDQTMQNMVNIMLLWQQELLNSISTVCNVKLKVELINFGNQWQKVKGLYLHRNVQGHSVNITSHSLSLS